MVTALLTLLVAASSASTPAPVVVQDPRISESSGLVASPTRPDLVWTVNDSGSAAVVYGVSVRSGRTVAVLRLARTDARDMEAMTATRGADGAGLLWIGDVGDNRAVRASVVLRLVREPLPTASATAPSPTTVRPVSLRVRYPDGPHDAETLIWTPDRRLLLVTKDLFSGVVYEVPAPAVAAAVAGRSTLDPVLAQPVADVAMSLVTDGAALPDGRIILRGYSGATIYRAPPRAGGAAGQELQPLQQVALPAQPQGETLTVVDGGRAVLVGSEGERQPLQRVELPPAVTAPATTGPATTGPVKSSPAASSPANSSPATTGPSAAPRSFNPAPGPRRPLLVLAVIAVALIAGGTVLRRRRLRR